MSVIVTDEDWRIEVRFIVRHDGVYPTPWRVRDTKTGTICASESFEGNAIQIAERLNAEAEASPTGWYRRLRARLSKQAEPVPEWKQKIDRMNQKIAAKDVRWVSDKAATAGGRQS